MSLRSFVVGTCGPCTSAEIGRGAQRDPGGPIGVPLGSVQTRVYNQALLLVLIEAGQRPPHSKCGGSRRLGHGLRLAVEVRPDARFTPKLEAQRLHRSRWRGAVPSGQVPLSPFFIRRPAIIVHTNACVSFSRMHDFKLHPRSSPSKNHLLKTAARAASVCTPPA